MLTTEMQWKSLAASTTANTYATAVKASCLMLEHAASAATAADSKSEPTADSKSGHAANRAQHEVGRLCSSRAGYLWLIAHAKLPPPCIVAYSSVGGSSES